MPCDDADADAQAYCCVNCYFENDSKCTESYSPTHTNHCEIAQVCCVFFCSFVVALSLCVRARACVSVFKTKALSIYVNVRHTVNDGNNINMVNEWWNLQAIAV